MKRLAALLVVVILMSGCTGKGEQLERAMALRSKMLVSRCTFTAQITADYGDKLYEFTMDCQADANGNLQFSVCQPESIAGVTGQVSQSEGKLTFDNDKAVAFELLADGQLAPVAAPWVLIRTLRSGYLTSCAQEGEMLRVAIDDSYEEDALHLDIWLDSQDLPARGEILWQGRRILSIRVVNFCFL